MYILSRSPGLGHVYISSRSPGVGHVYIFNITKSGLSYTFVLSQSRINQWERNPEQKKKEERKGGRVWRFS